MIFREVDFKLRKSGLVIGKCDLVVLDTKLKYGGERIYSLSLVYRGISTRVGTKAQIIKMLKEFKRKDIEIFTEIWQRN